MIQKKIISRKQFLNALSVLALGSLTFIWWQVVKKQKDSEAVNRIWKIMSPLTNGITFYQSFFMVVSDDQVKAFSTRCTHAGCRINKEINGIVVCPCHGSRFKADTGQPLNGPAVERLKQLSCHYDKENKEWIIKD